MTEPSLLAAVVLGFILSAVLGGNNFSTCLGASVGAKIIKMSDAVVLASLGVLLGTLLEGHKLSNVLDGKTLPSLSTSGLIVIIIASLVVMVVVTLFRLPLALSQVAVGAGWGLAFASGIRLSTPYSLEIVTSWILSPGLAFVGSAVIEAIVLRLGRNIRNIIALNWVYANLTLLAGFYAAYTLGANTLGLVVGLFPTTMADSRLLSVVFSAGTVLGMFLLSRGTVESVSDSLVGLNPSTALSAQFGGAVSVHLFTQLGLPVSISQVVIGGMEGAASTKQIAITNRRLLHQITAGWTAAPLAGAIVAFLLTKIA